MKCLILIFSVCFCHLEILKEIKGFKKEEKSQNFINYFNNEKNYNFADDIKFSFMVTKSTFV